MPVRDYLPTIGLEIHVHLKTRSKMFCACATSYGDGPNTQVCPTCLGLPGALPVLNERAIEMTILTGQLLGGHTPPVSKWDRKNYFYAGHAEELPDQSVRSAAGHRRGHPAL